MATTPPSIAIPGQPLGASAKYIPGPGTHLYLSQIHASILGPIHLTQPPKPVGPQKRLTKITPSAPTPLPTISVLRSPALDTKPGEAHAAKREAIPEVGSIVLCRVTRITARQASVAILVVGETVGEGEWQGVVRVQDVRATEKDRVKIAESFRPGDVVRAIVVCFYFSYFPLCSFCFSFLPFYFSAIPSYPSLPSSLCSFPLAPSPAPFSKTPFSIHPPAYLPLKPAIHPQLHLTTLSDLPWRPVKLLPLHRPQ